MVASHKLQQADISLRLIGMADGLTQTRSNSFQLMHHFVHEPET